MFASVAYSCLKDLMFTSRFKQKNPKESKQQNRFCVSLPSKLRPMLVQAGFRVLSFDLPEPQDTKILPRTHEIPWSQVWVWTQRFTWTVGHRSLCPTGWLNGYRYIWCKLCKQVGEVDSWHPMQTMRHVFAYFSRVSTAWNAVESLSKQFKKRFKVSILGGKAPGGA